MTEIQELQRRLNEAHESADRLRALIRVLEVDLDAAQEAADTFAKAPVMIRCIEHFNIPQQNRNEITGSECGACIAAERDAHSGLLNALLLAAGTYIKESHLALKDEAFCDHGVGICWCGYRRAYEGLQNLLLQVPCVDAERVKLTEKMLADTQRMEWIEASGDGSGWIARQSITGRGFRLHNVGRGLPFSDNADFATTARDAIDERRIQG